MPPNEHGVLLPIQVGKALTDTDLHIQADNEVNGQPCDNISAKNESYCELTAIYWAWKNLKKLYPDVKYVGLFHYRRFFAFHESKAFYHDIFKKEEAISEYTFSPEKVISILDKGYLVVSAKQIYPYSLTMDYCIKHMLDDYNTLKNVIDKNYPDYFADFITVMEHGNKFPGYNMFIMNWDDFEEYCRWLFSVLADVEPLVPYQQYNAYQKRVFGFMSERLLGVWLRKNRKKLKYCNVYYYDKYDGRSDSVSWPVLFIRWVFRLSAYLKKELTAKLLMTNITAKLLKLLKH